MGLLDRFTKRAKNVLGYAQAEAQHFKHPYVGAEHLLLGLILDKEGVAGKVLDDLGVKHARARSAVELIVGKGEARAHPDDLELTANAKKVIEYALEEGRKLNHHYVGTEHLLLGLVRKGEGVAAGVLEMIGVNLEQVRSAVLRELRQAPSSIAHAAKPTQSATPYLDALTTDLTGLAANGKLDPIIGRQKEIERVIQILTRRTKNNTALIGAPGVGKTAIAYGLVQRIVSDNVPDSLKGKRVVMLELSLLTAGIKERGHYGARLKRVLDELKLVRGLLVIEAFPTLLTSGDYALATAQLLAPALARNELQAVCVCERDGYYQYVEQDPTLARRFQAVLIDEPSIDEAIEIVRGVKSRYEDFHQLQFLDAAIQGAVHLSVRYVPSRFLPDKAIDLLDEAASRVRMYRSATPPSLRDALRELEAIRHEHATAGAQPELERDLKQREERMLERISTLEAQERSSDGSPYDRPYLTWEDIAEVVALWSGIPVATMTRDGT